MPSSILAPDEELRWRSVLLWVQTCVVQKYSAALVRAVLTSVGYHRLRMRLGWWSMVDTSGETSNN